MRPASPVTKDADDAEGKHVETAVISGGSADLAEAALEPVNPWSKRLLQLYLIVGVMFLTSTAHGYDSSLMGSILVTDSFRETFDTGKVGQKSALITAMYQIGGVCALPFMGPLIDQWGRRVGSMTGTGLIIVGTVLEGTSGASKNLAQFMAGRFFLGFGVYLTAASAPTYVVEMAHPKYRGVITGLYNCMYYTGAVMATGATRGSEVYTGEKGWLIPTWLQMVFPGIVFCSVMFFPESPRWLYTRGRQEEAKAILVKYHGGDNPDSAYVQLQLREFDATLEMNGSDRRWWDYSAIFRNAASVRRILCNVILSVFSQWCQGGVSYYIAGFYNSAGVRDETTILDLNLGSSLMCGAFAIAGASMADTWGRRKVLIYTQAALCLCWVGITTGTAMYAKTGSSASCIAGILFYWIFQAVFSLGFTPLQTLYPVEVLSYEMRAKGMSINSMANSASSLVNQFGTATALQRIGWKTYLVFAC
jgi:sugar porter (SP) family MFS transporter